MRSSHAPKGVAIALATVAATLAGTARAERPSLGFTSEVSAGLGYTVFGSKDPDTANYGQVGLALPTLGVGLFVHRNIAVEARATSITYSHLGTTLSSGVYGVAGQFWVADNFFLGVGIGAALHGRGTIIPTKASALGLGFTGRAGWVFHEMPHHAFSLQLELSPGFFPDTDTYVAANVWGTALQVGWQYY